MILANEVVQTWTGCTMSKLADGTTVTMCDGPVPAWHAWVSLGFHLAHYAVLIWLVWFWIEHRKCTR